MSKHFSRKVCCFVALGLLAAGIVLAAFLYWERTLMTSQSDRIATSDALHQVWNSNLFADASESARPIFWVDDSTLLFAANKDAKPRTDEDARARTHWLYLWRLGEAPHSVGTDPQFAANNGYCAAQGMIMYYQSAIDPATNKSGMIRWIGAPGQEKEAGPRRYISQQGAAGNLFPNIEPADCEGFADPSMHGRQYVTDSKRRFYLDFGTDPGRAAIGAKPGEPIILMRANRADPVELPVSNAQAARGATAYRIFDGAFFVFQSQISDSPLPPSPFTFRQWREAGCWPIWRVEPESRKTEKLCIPYGFWAGDGSAGSIDILPTRDGLFFTYFQFAGPTGIYKLEGQSVRRIVRGGIGSAVVSPDGHRIAFRYVPNDDAYRMGSPVNPTIAVIEIRQPTE
jgi:hypothetical protein